MQRWTSRNPPRYLAQITLIPLMDLVFILFFVFLVVVPLLKKESGVPMARLVSGAPADSVVLRISAEGAMRLNDREVTLKDLSSRAADLCHVRPGVGVVVETPPGYAVSDLVAVSKALREGGVDKMVVKASAANP